MVKKAKPSLYSLHPSIAYASAVIANFLKNTGKPIDAWVKLVEKEGISEPKAQRDWLMKTHKLGNTQASMVLEYLAGGGQDFTDPELYLARAPGYVEAMYKGPKSAIRPIHDRLIQAALELGPEVKICPCETIVPFYRHHVFAQIKPSTKTRLDFGLALKGTPRRLSERLIDTGGLAKKDRITHRFALESAEQVDDEVLDWLRHAFELDAE